MIGTGQRGAADASNFMNVGGSFAQNYGDLYNRASQDMLGNAINRCATSNSDPLIRSAMRDHYRLTSWRTSCHGTGLSASATGNTNASRRGTRMKAILERVVIRIV